MMFRKLLPLSLAIVLVSAAMPTATAQKATDGSDSQDPIMKLEDYTEKLELKAGMTIAFPIREGIDTRWKHIGNYEFIVMIDEAGPDGFSYDWKMTPPANATGHRGVSQADLADSYKVSLFYPDGQTCILDGYTNTVRVSDKLYSALKAGNTVPFELDGPEIPAGKKHKQALPNSIRPLGLQFVTLIIDGRRVRVRSIKAETDNGWSYWIVDNPAFPLLVQGNAPFRWGEPRFSYSSASSEARKVIKQLSETGEATTHLILFAFDSDKLTEKSKEILNDLAKYLQAKPELNLAIEGHTDSIGSMSYNLKLSQRRAEAVRSYLIKECGITSQRLKANGFGYTKPVASNSTDQGRARNRRVVFKKG